MEYSKRPMAMSIYIILVLCLLEIGYLILAVCFPIFCFPSFRHNKILKITEKFFSCLYFLQKIKRKQKGNVGIDRASMIDLRLLKFFDRHLTRFVLKWIAFFNR